ncbi:unnamed protein product [Trichogramma brassicae]|uniref:Uncharacterized protein n=1 Tax=Trichogramma brassicae TaxID=86971 RepID=A0A6H5IAH2_9HYME|nr:unnamed protein product [Trichogramma brassicae]
MASNPMLALTGSTTLNSSAFISSPVFSPKALVALTVATNLPLRTVPPSPRRFQFGRLPSLGLKIMQPCSEDVRTSAHATGEHRTTCGRGTRPCKGCTRRYARRTEAWGWDTPSQRVGADFTAGLPRDRILPGTQRLSHPRLPIPHWKGQASSGPLGGGRVLFYPYRLCRPAPELRPQLTRRGQIADPELLEAVTPTALSPNPSTTPSDCLCNVRVLMLFVTSRYISNTDDASADSSDWKLSRAAHAHCRVYCIMHDLGALSL